MKQFSLFFLAILFPYFLNAQCEGPQLEPFATNSYDNFTVRFTAQASAESYRILVFAEYDTNHIIETSQPLVFEGPTTPGLNEVVVDLNDLQTASGFGETYYYTTHLSTICADQEESSQIISYLSAFSILNDPGYNFGPYFFRPITPLPDYFDYSFDTYFPISNGSASEEIESLSVFVDIAHSYNGDLSVQLISPVGTVVDLISYPNELFYSSGLSVVFSDDATNVLNQDSRQGLVLPAQSLDVFQGESPEGVWRISIWDNQGADEGLLMGAALIFNTSPCEAYISGNAFYDQNDNGVFDAEEPPHAFGAVYNSLDDDYSGTNQSGEYLDCTSLGDGQMSLYNTPLYYASTAVDFTVDLDDEIQGINIPISPIPGIEDLVLDIYSLTPDRPGFENTYFLDYSNIGTECVQNVEISVSFENAVTLLDVDAPNSSIVDNDVLVSIGELCPQEDGLISIQALNSDTLELEYILDVIGQITPIEGDEAPENNNVHVESEVVGSYDPNDKAVNETTITPEFVESGAPLKYKVRFQNTGTYYAERVLVVDTIDANLDPNTLTLLNHSHPVEVSNNGNVFYFEFDQIFLPDSSADLLGSMGFFRYSVKPFENLPIGTEIDNVAGIFFDFNPPIITNTVTTTVDQAYGIPELTFEAKLFPNPAVDQLQIQLPSETGNTLLRIYDVSGKEVLVSNAMGGNQISLDVSDLESGLYLIHFDADVHITPQSWIKQ